MKSRRRRYKQLVNLKIMKLRYNAIYRAAYEELLAEQHAAIMKKFPAALKTISFKNNIPIGENGKLY